MYGDYFKVYGISLILGFSPLIIQYVRSENNSSIHYLKNIKPIYLILVPLIISFPIYYLAFDWGRYLYISYTSSLIIFLFLINNKILLIKNKSSIPKQGLLIKVLIIVAFLIFAFGWTSPYCCDRTLKFGIFRSIDKGFDYFKSH